MHVALVVALASASLFAILRKCWFLAPTRLGWFMMLANVPYETFCRGRRKRWHVDLAAYVLLAVGWTLLLGPWAGAVWTGVFGLTWVYSLLTERRWLSDVLTEQDATHPGIPLPLPRLIVNVRGPVLERGRVYDLGDWPVGRSETFEFLILNPADRVHCQFPFRFEVTASGGGVTVTEDPTGNHEGPDPGEVVTLPVCLTAERPSDPVTLRYCLTLGSYRRSGTLRVRSVFDPSAVEVTSARISRWKGGARGAWTWRGDTDLYDPATWQSVEGLTPCFDLARRFAMPHTMFLSAKLSLDESQSRAHSEALGLDRRSEEIPAFIDWLRNEVLLASCLDWPVQADRPFFCELANHYWLHYGTHSAADEGNDWRIGTGPGEGRYFWSEADGNSRQEQTDNARQCVRTFERLLDYTPTAWGIPGRASDRHTPQAIEAAGMLVSGDADCQAFVNVFCQPPPHHPEGTQHLVELSKKYPGDTLHGNQLAMLKYWTAHARRHGRAMVFMAHHHLRGYEASTCFRLTEEMLRHVLDDYQGDLYVATMTAVGLYWERVLCPAHRWVAAEPAGGVSFTVTNTGDETLDAIPVEVAFTGGRRTLALVDVPAGGTAEVAWSQESL